MEQRYNLPLRNSADTRTSHHHHAWETSVYPSYAAVSPQQHQYYQALVPHQTPGGFQSQSLPLPVGSPGQYGPYLPTSPLEGAPSKGHSIYPSTAPFPTTPAPLPHPHNNVQLPVPSSILRSQDQGPCLACGHRDCHLSSHMHFSRQKRRAQQQIADQVELTPRPIKAVLLPMQLTSPAIVQETEREHLLALWAKEWSPTRVGPERHLFPEAYIERIIPAAKRHGPLFQAVLAYSGVMWTSANNNLLGDLASRQQAVAVEMLSQACPSEQEASTDEAMMAATLLLLVYMEQGNDFEVSKHIAGLEHLVKLRGGAYYLGLGGVLAETLLHADHMQAIFFNQSPVWRLVVPALDDIGLPPKMGSGFRQMPDNQVDLQVVLAARSVCKIADIFDCAAGVGIPKKTRHAFGYLSMMATYQLAHCNAVHHGSATVNECVCLALILFHHVVLSNDGSVSPGILRIEYRFWMALQESEGKGGMLGILPCLYMWMITMGLTVAVRRECSYRMLAVEKLRAARIPAGIQTWDQFKTGILDYLVWLPGAQEEIFRRIWKEVEGLPGMKTNGNV